MSASERRLFWFTTIAGLIILDLVISVCCLLANGRHAALICAIVTTFIIIGFSVMAAMSWCLIPDRLHRRLRNWWHKMCCKGWDIPYKPLPVKLAAKHPTDIVPEGKGPLTKGDAVVVRRMREEQFHRLFLQSGLSINLRVPGEE